jgi:hypothetical protein
MNELNMMVNVLCVSYCGAVSRQEMQQRIIERLYMAFTRALDKENFVRWPPR